VRRVDRDGALAEIREVRARMHVPTGRPRLTWNDQDLAPVGHNVATSPYIM
jgi:hypothetical protein